MWDLSCPDWATRIRDGRSLIPDLPLNKAEAEMGLAFFDELRLPDVPEKPKLADACGPWFRDIVRSSFGSWEPATQTRHIRDILTLAPKASSKTSYSAGLILAVMCMNKRPRAEALFVGPTQAISDRAYEQAVGMIDESRDLKRRFRPRDHIKTIEDLFNKSEMRVRTFDLSILTGAILIFVLLDELHLLGRNSHTTKVLRQIRGGLDKTPEGQLLITTTQSDEAPAGAFKDELDMARRIRNGQFKGLDIRPMLPVLYEFPDDIAVDRERWENPANWPMVMPNLGRSVHLPTLIPDWNTEKEKGEHAIRVWASQHLNIQIGVGLLSDAWAGAYYWEGATDKSLTLDEILARSDVAVVGGDGGGLDDLLGAAVIGRCKETRDWLLWNHAWAQTDVFDRRKEIVPRLQDFMKAGTLTLCSPDDPTQDVREFADICERVRNSGLMPEKQGVGLDPYSVGGLVDELASRKITDPQVMGVGQGTKLSPATWGLERKLKDRTLWHAGQDMMAWCVGNAKVEQRGNAVMITKQAAGKAKIDPLVASLNAAMLMSRNPEAKKSPQFQMIIA